MNFAVATFAKDDAVWNTSAAEAVAKWWGITSRRTHRIGGFIHDPRLIWGTIAPSRFIGHGYFKHQFVLVVGDKLRDPRAMEDGSATTAP